MPSSQAARQPNSRLPLLALCGAATFLAACGPGTGESASSRASELAGSDCDVIVTNYHHYRFIDVRVKTDVCRPEGVGLPTFRSTDETTGAAVDLDQLIAADRSAFHSWHSSIEPEFRVQLESSPTVLHDAYVWFYVDGRDRPRKEWLVAESADAEASSQLTESRMRATAQALAVRLGQMPSVVLRGTVTPAQQYGIPVVRVRANLEGLVTIGSWSEVWRVDAVPKDPVGLSDDYYTTTAENVLDYLGYDGTGQTVAHYEWHIPDSWVNLPGVPAGSCTDNYGASRDCHCPSGPAINHPRLMLGILRRNTGILGMANAATTISANSGGNCATNGPDNYSSALNWATSQDARVINHSSETGTGAYPSAHDVFFDYKASVSPWPTVTAAAGNNPAANVANKLRNGLCVGGSIETGGANRALVVIDNKSFLNGTGPTGYEVPHISAISEGVNSAGLTQSSVEVTGGTSAAAPQAAGVIASLQEANAALRSWPEVVVPGIMVSADEDTDGTVLSLNDAVDDKDGAGLLNGWQALQVLDSSKKVDGGNAAARSGHDYGTVAVWSTPANSFYGEEYKARVPSGKQLRAAFFVQTRPTCPSNPDSYSCGPNPYPHIGIWVYDGTTLVAVGSNTNNNYAYTAFTNSSGSQKDYTLKMYVGSYNGLSSTTYGAAWSSW